MTTHHPQHSTNRAPREPRRRPSDGIPCTDDDIVNTITQLAAQQSSRFVLIAHLRVSLGLDMRDLDWLRDTITRMDESGRVMLSPIERPQQMAAYQAMWFARNASGIPCHEVCAIQHPASSQLQLVQQLQDEQREGAVPMTAGDFIRAAADGLQLLARNRQHELLRRAAQTAKPFTVHPAPLPA